MTKGKKGSAFKGVCAVSALMFLILSILFFAIGKLLPALSSSAITFVIVYILDSYDEEKE